MAKCKAVFGHCCWETKQTKWTFLKIFTIISDHFNIAKYCQTKTADLAFKVTLLSSNWAEQFNFFPVGSLVDKCLLLGCFEPFQPWITHNSYNILQHLQTFQTAQLTSIYAVCALKSIWKDLVKPWLVDLRRTSLGMLEMWHGSCRCWNLSNVFIGPLSQLAYQLFCSFRKNYHVSAAGLFVRLALQVQQPDTLQAAERRLPLQASARFRLYRPLANT